MWKEILQIIPKITGSDLTNMEKSLSSRFARAAKTFGKGLAATLSGGGLVGAAVGLVDKLLNPLKETQDAIDKTLKMSDDVVTNAKAFNSTAGRLFRLQALGKATGIDEGSLSLLIQKFQASVAEAKADPTKQTSVRNFVGQTDTVQGFFEFIQGLQKLSKDQQILVQQEVFGEKQILKMADFLQADFGSLSKKLGGPDAAALDPKLQKLGDLNDLKDLLSARRDLQDTFKKGSLITEGMVRSQDEQAKKDLEKENLNIQGYQNLANIAVAVSEVTNTLKTLAITITGAVTKFYDIAGVFKKLSESRAFRGILGFIKAE